MKSSRVFVLLIILLLSAVNAANTLDDDLSLAQKSRSRSSYSSYGGYSYGGYSSYGSSSYGYNSYSSSYYDPCFSQSVP